MKIMLNQVDHIMHGQNITIRRDLSMQGDQHPAGTVIVNDQVVDADDTFIRHDDIIDLLHKLRVRCLTKQRTDGILGGTDAGQTDEQSHDNTTVAVNLESGKMGYQSSN